MPALPRPIGYQTNTLVYSLGGYSFKDFLRIGVPLNISVGVLASFFNTDVLAALGSC